MLSQFDLAVRIGVKPMSVSLWELDKAQPHDSNMRRLLEEFPELGDLAPNRDHSALARA